MAYITIDGDDIGQKITSCYLRNDLAGLKIINDLVKEKTNNIAKFLESEGFEIIFAAADGVAGYLEDSDFDGEFLFTRILEISEEKISFSAGVGSNLREAYVALLSAKSEGKCRIQTYENIQCLK